MALAVVTVVVVEGGNAVADAVGDVTDSVMGAGEAEIDDVVKAAIAGDDDTWEDDDWIGFGFFLVKCSSRIRSAMSAIALHRGRTNGSRASIPMRPSTKASMAPWGR